ncbi:hypothetical protein SDC9_147588 [bioreactor metagenome]|uniref:Uncharacterized protein n=1 Tax=bioreactor metagenome TaxID=1076179 RepID=A0A645EI21_9ZZZZ
MAPEALAYGVDVDIQHHHHEQEQHHHGAQVHQHQGNAEEFSLQEQPDGGRLRESQNQIEHRVHRIARGDDSKGCNQQHYREHVEKNGFGVHESTLLYLFKEPLQRYLASAALLAAISAS